MAEGSVQIMDMLDGAWETSGAAVGGKNWISRDEQERFLLSLLSLGLDRVAAEPERLANECHAVKKDTETHAVSNYSAFLQSAVCVRSVREELELSGRLLHELAADVPSLQRACEEVDEHAKAVDSLRKQTQTTWKVHAQLLEVLEVPQLMDTAVRNEYYEEALELASFARRLHARYQDNTLIESLFQAVERSENNMLYQLLQKLQVNFASDDISLTLCFRVTFNFQSVYMSLECSEDLVGIVKKTCDSSSWNVETCGFSLPLMRLKSLDPSTNHSAKLQGLPRIKECSQISSLLDKVRELNICSSLHNVWTGDVLRRVFGAGRIGLSICRYKNQKISDLVELRDNCALQSEKFLK
eukprot:752363-Hanusia_phi.AAC.4